MEAGAEISDVTDAHGRFRVAGLRPGVHDLRAEIRGFAPQGKKGPQLFLGQEATIHFEVSVAGVRETVNVTSEPPRIEVTKSEDSTPASSTRSRSMRFH